MDNIDEYLECPYNKSHRILSSRMQYHLVKCQKNYPTTEKETCPFDATHRVPKPEFQYHLTVCPNRKILETHKYQLESETDHGDLGLAPYHHTDLPQSEENWDNDPVVPPYQPHLIENKSVFRSIAGATKSQRKQFRLAERRRVQQMNDSGHVDNEGAAADVDFDDRPLRVPNRPSQALQSLRAMNPSMGLGRGSISIPGDEAARSLPNHIGMSTDPLSSLPLGLGRGAIRKQSGV